MIKNMNQNQKEFLEFQNGNHILPPPTLSQKIINQVHNDLNPSVWKVFTKLSLIHFLMGLVTLSICPQFGFRIFGSGTGLMGMFMNLGSTGCAIACGSFFFGSTFSVASLALKPEELIILKRNKFLSISALAFMSIGFFIMLNTEIVIGFALIWLLGAFITGMSMIEIIFAFRMRYNSL